MYMHSSADREALPKGYILNIDADSVVKLTIGDVIGKGGCCIAYKGEMHLGLDKPIDVILKECFPANLPIVRNNSLNKDKLEDYSLVFIDKEEEKKYESNFNLIKCRFETGLYNLRNINEINKDKDLFGIGKANNTTYSFFIDYEGRILSKYAEDNKNNLSISEIVDIVISLCESIKKFHDSLYIYLDCKPDNILLIENKGTKASVELIDFDTVIHYANRRNTKISRTYSLGWAAPEQLIFSGEVSYSTDIFSIAAVLFWLLTGQKPYQATDINSPDYTMLEQIQQDKIIWREISQFCLNENQEIIDKINEILKKALNPNQNERYQKLSEMIDELEDLSKATKRKKILENNNLPESTNRFKYNSNSTSLIGRDKEINILLDMCNSCERFYWIGISGRGGSGKSKLAYELCLRMQKQYWKVIFSSKFKYSKDDISDFLKNPVGDILICLDYINQEKDDIFEFIKYVIIEKLNSYKYKIRYVLIERDDKDVKTEDYDIEGYNYLKKNNVLNFKENIKLEMLSDQDMKSIVLDYMVKQNKVNLSNINLNDSLNLVINSLKTVDPEFKRPLYALIIADAFLNEENLLEWDRDDALRYILGKEMNRLSEIVKDSKYMLDIIAQKKYINAVKYLYALATYLSSISIGDYFEIIQEKFKIPSNDEKLVWILRELAIIDDKDNILGFVPDLIGEYFCIDFFDRYHKEKGLDAVKEFVNLVIDADLSSFIRYSQMIYDDFIDIIDGCQWMEAIRNIEISEKYKYIPSFNGCSFLKNISFSDKTLAIKYYAFYKSKNLLELSFGYENSLNSSIIEIGEWAFADCINLRNFVFPDSIQKIGGSAFCGCFSLTDIEIPPRVEVIKNGTFGCCTSLRSISFEKNESINLNESSFSFCRELREIKGIENISRVYKYAFRSCIKIESLTFSEKLRIIGKGAFLGCANLKYVDLSKTKIKYIPRELFKDCTSLIEVLLPDNIEKIEDYAFYACKNLEKIEFKSGIKIIGRLAFKGCEKLKSLNFPKSLTVIKSHAFENCTKISKISFEKTTEIIENHAFSGCTSLSFAKISGLDNSNMINFCGFTFSSFSDTEFDFVQNYLNLEHVIIPKSVITIGNDVFRGEIRYEYLREKQDKNIVLKSVIITQSVKKIGDGAFKDCINLEYLKFEDCKYIEIGYAAFLNCRMLKIIDGTIPTERIGDYTFQNCIYLESVNISERLEYIGRYAFKNCLSLKYINIENDKKIFNTGTAAFDGCKSLKYPIDRDSIKKNILNSENYILEGFVFSTIGEKELKFISEYLYLEIVDIPDSCIDISNVVFRDIKKMRKLIIPDSIKSLSKGIFKNCKLLESVELPDIYDNIPESAFENCRSLENVIFRQERNNSIKDNINYDKNPCITDIYSKDLQEYTINISSKIRTIGSYAFRNCFKIRRIVLSDTLESIGKGAFIDCYGLIEVVNLENTKLKKISDYLFYNCGSLEVLTLPNSIKSIGENAFYICASIKSIILPQNLIKIANHAFFGCYYLRDIYFSSNLKYIGRYAFGVCKVLIDVELHSLYNLESIGEGAFSDCYSIERIKIPKNIKKLSSGLFAHCENLKEVFIPDHIVEIPDDCFERCRSLKNINYYSKSEDIDV